MIKIVFCLRRPPELSQEEFQAYWRDRHAPLVREVAPMLNIRRYVQSHAFGDAAIGAGIEARGAMLPPFDGVAELWWDSIDDITSASATREGRAAGRLLLADERKFIDLEASSLFYTREHVIVGE